MCCKWPDSTDHIKHSLSDVTNMFLKSHCVAILAVNHSNHLRTDFLNSLLKELPANIWMKYSPKGTKVLHNNTKMTNQWVVPSRQRRHLHHSSLSIIKIRWSTWKSSPWTVAKWNTADLKWLQSRGSHSLESVLVWFSYILFHSNHNL